MIRYDLSCLALIGHVLVRNRSYTGLSLPASLGNTSTLELASVDAIVRTACLLKTPKARRV